MEHDSAIQLLRGPSLLRDYAVGGIELRAAEDPASPMVTFVGHASVTDRAYPMYGGAENGFPGYDETVAGGAFKKTLSESPDVAFLVNHGGMTLARTKAGTLRLAEDKVGLAAEADLNRQVSIVNDVALLMEAKNLDEMSFAFRVVKETWTNSDGEFRRWWEEDALYRTINEVSLHKGDVSVVNYGANPYTSASLRALDDAVRAMALVAGESDVRAAIAHLEARLTALEPTPVLDLETLIEQERREIALVRERYTAA